MGQVRHGCYSSKHAVSSVTERSTLNGFKRSPGLAPCIMVPAILDVGLINGFGFADIAA